MTAVDLTLGIPTFNSAPYLDDVFRSLKHLSVIPQCILFTDNQSNDDTVERIQRFRVENPRFYVRLHLNESNLGIAGNYNSLVMRAFDTRWLQILDSDDWLMGDYYAKLAPALEDDTADIIVTSMRSSSTAVNAYVRAFEAVMRAARQRAIPPQVQILGSACTRSSLIYRTSALKREPFLDPCFDGSDIVHTDKLLKKNTYRPEAKVFYRIHPESATSRLERKRKLARENHERYLAYVRTLPPVHRTSYTLDFLLRKKLGRLIRLP